MILDAVNQKVNGRNVDNAEEVVFDRETSIRLRLHADDARSLRQMAESKGLAESELVREWVLEKLQAQLLTPRPLVVFHSAKEGAFAEREATREVAESTFFKPSRESTQDSPACWAMTKEAVPANVKWNCALRMVYPAFARRQISSLGRRPRSGALCVAAACAALATLIIAWLVLTPVKARLPGVAPAVTLQWQTSTSSYRKTAIAPVVDPESLSRALVAVDYCGARGLRPVALAALAERVRPSLHLEPLANEWTNSPGTSGVALRWRGAARDPNAAALVEALARELASRWQTQTVQRDEQASEEATQALSAATTKIQELQVEFDQALTRLGELGEGVGNTPRGVPPTAAGPTLAPPEPAVNSPGIAASRTPPAARHPSGYALASRQARLESELEDLEIKRDSLAERLTPSHPEMRALDEQIGEVRAALANASYPAVEEPLPEPGTASRNELSSQAAAAPAVVPLRNAPWRMQSLTQTQAAWRRLAAALVARDKAALAASRAQTELRQALRSAVVERLPATVSQPPVVEVAWSLVAAVLAAAGAAGWLVISFWPMSGAVVLDADDLRQTTRLPVIVVPSPAPPGHDSPTFDSKWRLRPAFAECMQSADRRSPARHAG